MKLYPESTAQQHEKARANRAMFDSIASRYDLLNSLISMGLDRRWRRMLVRQCDINANSRCLDICCGTGAVAGELSRLGASVIGLDASEAMLEVARIKYPRISFLQGDALCLPFPDGVFDTVAIAYSNRNVANLPALFSEMRRVTRTGGRVVSLEMHRPESRIISGLFFAYFNTVPALLARLSGTDSSAYRFLPASVYAYPNAQQIAEIMRACGLSDVSITQLWGGAVVIHRGLCW